MRPGRGFLRALINASATTPHLDHWVHLNAPERADISWWHTFIVHWNGISLLPSAAPAYFITSDASGSWGCGALHYNQWLQLAWPPEWLEVPIAPKELVPIVLVVALWGPQWAGRNKVCGWCDNSAVVWAINKGSARDSKLMSLLRSLCFLLMLWAASCVGFFGFLRAGEFTIPYPQSYDSSVHLSLSDLAVDSHTTPSIIRLRIKQSKTDHFSQGVDIFLGATNADICPVQAVLQFLAMRNPSPGPLFVFQSGSPPLTRATLVSHLRTALQKAGIPHSAYSGHSFRIGAATTAAQCGLEDSLIQTLGRWKSTAYKT